MTRRERELRRLIKDEGLALESLELNGATHYKAIVRGAHGSAMVVAALSPGSGRSIHHVRAILRQIADGRYQGMRKEAKLTDTP